MKLWAYEDVHYWGPGLVEAAGKRGYDARLFDEPRAADEGIVFWHMHHHPNVRQVHKRAMALMTMNPRLLLIPDYRSSILFDDKLEQARQLARWTPRTNVFYTPKAAREWLENAEYPFMSKSAEGASSHNVRLVENYKAAHEEIKYAFSDRGIRCRYALAQRGYLLWQQFIPDNAYDLRVIAVGNKRLVLRRFNREGVPMASGSGKLEPIKVLDAEAASALAWSNSFFTHERMPWCGIDLVSSPNRFDETCKQWHVLECTVSWTMTGYNDCSFFNHDAREGDKGIGRTGAQVWEVLLDELEAGRMGELPKPLVPA